MYLKQILKGYLNPSTPRNAPESLKENCLRAAAIYATTSLYDFNSNINRSPELVWEEIFPLLDQHFFQLVPGHFYEVFLDKVLCALEIAVHYDLIGKDLIQYIVLFFPKRIKRFSVRKYVDRVLKPIIVCLPECLDLEELYLEKANSPAISTYLLAHIFKSMKNLRVVALPNQADDDVASIIGMNCPKLESIVLTGTKISNSGLSWLLCCRQLHTVIMPGFYSRVSIKGVALLLNGLPGLKHVVYDKLSDVFTFIDFNAPESVRFQLKTVLFHSLEHLSSNHLELVTRLCPQVEWLSLNSALPYDLEGLGHLNNLKVMRLTYKNRPLDQTVFDFFSLSCQNLTHLQLFDVENIEIDDILSTVGLCPLLEYFILCNCSLSINISSYNIKNLKTSPVLIENLQIVSIVSDTATFYRFICLFKNLYTLEMDKCDLEFDQIQSLLYSHTRLHTIKCSDWTNLSLESLKKLQRQFKKCNFFIQKPFVAYDGGLQESKTMSALLINSYASFSASLDINPYSS